VIYFQEPTNKKPKRARKEKHLAVLPHVYEQMVRIQKYLRTSSMTLCFEKLLSEHIDDELKGVLSRSHEHEVQPMRDEDNEEGGDGGSQELLDQLIVRRIQLEASISDEKMPVVLALASLRDSVRTRRKTPIDAIVSATPSSRTNGRHVKLLNDSSAQLLKKELASVSRVHLSVDLSTRDSMTHMLLYTSFWANEAPQIRLLYSGSIPNKSGMYFLIALVLLTVR
jgi:hypothetical protein